MIKINNKLAKYILKNKKTGLGISLKVMRKTKKFHGLSQFY